MISLTALQAEMEAIQAAIPGIDHLIRVVTDNQATARLRDRDGSCMLFTLPSWDQTGDAGNPSESHAIIIWMVEKPLADADDQQELEAYQRLAELLQQVKEHIRVSQEDGCSLWWRLNIASLSMEPEWNAFGGFNGWALAVEF